MNQNSRPLRGKYRGNGQREYHKNSEPIGTNSHGFPIYRPDRKFPVLNLEDEEETRRLREKSLGEKPDEEYPSVKKRRDNFKRIIRRNR